MSHHRVDFTDRVMRAVGDQPAPSATGSFVTAVRARSLGDAFSAFSVAWHLGTVRRWSVGRRVRLQAIALVMTVLLALGFASIATATAVLTGVNELGNVIHHQFGTDEQGDVHNGSPDPSASEHGQGGGRQSDQPEHGGNSSDGSSGPSDVDGSNGNQGGGGAQGTDGAGGPVGSGGAPGADAAGSGQGDPTP
jgi:hypothetical protein